jgi:hypothetical protein
MQASITKKEGLCGGPGGSEKDMDITGITRIVKVGIRHGEVIDAIIVSFERNGAIESTDLWGGEGGSLTEVRALFCTFSNAVHTVFSHCMHAPMHLYLYFIFLSF